MGIKPFRASPNKVKTAADLLPVLKIFVAPGFFEPYFLGSGSLNITELITANGIDPAMYNMATTHHNVRGVLLCRPHPLGIHAHGAIGRLSGSTEYEHSG